MPSLATTLGTFVLFVCSCWDDAHSHRAVYRLKRLLSSWVQAYQHRQRHLRHQWCLLGRHVCVWHKLSRQRLFLPAYVFAEPTIAIMWAQCAHLVEFVGENVHLGATCTNNVASGFFFDPTEVVLAGTNATTTSCPPGLAGTATRLCVWNGPNSASGVWASPISNCQRTCRSLSSLCLPTGPKLTRGLRSGGGACF
jgi:hypothetical protein